MIRLSLVFTLLTLVSIQSIAATTKLTCRADTAANFVNTCPPDVVFRVAMQDGTNLDDLNLSNLLSISLFDLGARDIVKIVHTTTSPSISVAYYGVSKPSATGGVPKKLMVQISSWPNSSAVGISQMLSKGKPISKYEGNVFYNFSPEKNIANTCSLDSTSNASLSVLKCPTVSTSTSPNLVTSAVAASEYLELPTPVGGSLGNLNNLLNPPTPLFLTGFGVAVNTNLYKALQAAQMSKGMIPPSCVLGDTTTGACQPSLSSAVISGLFSKQGNVRSANKLIAGDNNQLFVNLYSTASSTQAATGIAFLNNPCGKRANSTVSDILHNLTFVDSNDETSSFFVQERTSHIAVSNWLNGLQSGYAIGVLPLSVVPSSTDNWNFVRINAQSPNFSPAGIYDPMNRIGISSGNYGFATTSFAISLLRADPTVNAAAKAFTDSLLKIFNTDLTGIAYLDGSNSDASGKQSAVQRVKSNNCSPLVAMNKGFEFKLNDNITYKDGTQTIHTKYLDGTSFQTVNKSIGTPVVTWGSDHITKTTTYYFADGTSNPVVSTVQPKISVSYALDKQTISTTYGDGYSTSQTNNATGNVETWGVDRVTKTTTYNFPNGGANTVSASVPGTQLSTPAPTYNGDTQTVKMRYFDGKPDASATFKGAGNTTFSSDGGTKTTVYTFPDATTNTITLVGTRKVDIVSYTMTSYSITAKFTFADGTTNTKVTSSAYKEIANTSYDTDKQSIKVMYMDGTMHTFINIATSSAVISGAGGSTVTRYYFADGTFNDM